MPTVRSAGIGVVATAGTPSECATAFHAHRPAAMPSGMPAMTDATVTVLACQPSVETTWRRRKPSARSNASSRRRR